MKQPNELHILKAKKHLKWASEELKLASDKTSTAHHYMTINEIMLVLDAISDDLRH